MSRLSVVSILRRCAPSVALSFGAPTVHWPLQELAAVSSAASYVTSNPQAKWPTLSTSAPGGTGEADTRLLIRLKEVPEQNREVVCHEDSRWPVWHRKHLQIRRASSVAKKTSPTADVP